MTIARDDGVPSTVSSRVPGRFSVGRLITTNDPLVVSKHTTQVVLSGGSPDAAARPGSKNYGPPRLQAFPAASILRKHWESQYSPFVADLRRHDVGKELP